MLKDGVVRFGQGGEDANENCRRRTEENYDSNPLVCIWGGCFLVCFLFDLEVEKFCFISNKIFFSTCDIHHLISWRLCRYVVSPFDTQNVACMKRR